MCEVDTGGGGPAQAPHHQPAGAGCQWGPAEQRKHFKLLSIKADEAVILWDFILYKHKEIETICYNV